MYTSNGWVHPVYMVKRVTARFRQKKTYRRTFIRQWREKENLTLAQLAERLTTAHDLPMTHATLSRIERGLSPYRQPQLEAIAVELKTDPASLIMRDPDDPEGLWSLWDQSKPGERKMIVDIARTVLKTGT